MACTGNIKGLKEGASVHVSMCGDKTQERVCARVDWSSQGRNDNTEETETPVSLERSGVLGGSWASCCLIFNGFNSVY